MRSHLVMGTLKASSEAMPLVRGVEGHETSAGKIALWLGAWALGPDFLSLNRGWLLACCMTM